MDLDFIARLLDLVERSNLAELELSQDGTRLRLVKAHHVPRIGLAPAGTAGQAAALPLSSALAASPAQASSKRHEIKAGFPGTFYRAPAPGEQHFVAIGDRVEEGRQLAIVEAMKTMNPVEADRAGTVREILLDDASPVEPGMLLFVLEAED